MFSLSCFCLAIVSARLTGIQTGNFLVPACFGLTKSSMKFHIWRHGNGHACKFEIVTFAFRAGTINRLLHGNRENLSAFQANELHLFNLCSHVFPFQICVKAYKIKPNAEQPSAKMPKTITYSAFSPFKFGVSAIVSARLTCIHGAFSMAPCFGLFPNKLNNPFSTFVANFPNTAIG